MLFAVGQAQVRGAHISTRARRISRVLLVRCGLFKDGRLVLTILTDDTRLLVRGRRLRLLLAHIMSASTRAGGTRFLTVGLLNYSTAALSPFTHVYRLLMRALAEVDSHDIIIEDVISAHLQLAQVLLVALTEWLALVASEGCSLIATALLLVVLIDVESLRSRVHV